MLRELTSSEDEDLMQAVQPTFCKILDGHQIKFWKYTDVNLGGYSSKRGKSLPHWPTQYRWVETMLEESKKNYADSVPFYDRFALDNGNMHTDAFLQKPQE